MMIDDLSATPMITRPLLLRFGVRIPGGPRYGIREECPFLDARDTLLELRKHSPEWCCTLLDGRGRLIVYRIAPPRLLHRQFAHAHPDGTRAAWQLNGSAGLELAAVCLLWLRIPGRPARSGEAGVVGEQGQLGAVVQIELGQDV